MKIKSCTIVAGKDGQNHKKNDDFKNNQRHVKRTLQKVVCNKYGSRTRSFIEVKKWLKNIINMFKREQQ
ncbi:hypothetical protein P8452_49937 [Trifolium repens]|nr:hypothetical protein P8452_23348 [Trifolium repens]WJX65256.1 hypothetical protein P8452_49937 [Trifolium repens]